MGELFSAQQDDKELQAEDKKGNRWEKVANQLKEVDGVIYVQQKNRAHKELVIAVPEALVNKVLDFHHLPEHRSYSRMYETMRSKYFIPKIREEIQKYTKLCVTCQIMNTKPTPKTSPIKTTTPDHPWTTLQGDLIGPMPKTLRGNVYILTVIDCFSRWVELRPLKNKSTEAVGNGLLDVFMVRGPPLNLQLDNDAALKSQVMVDYLADMGIFKGNICPYQPTSNGQVESANKRVKRLLQIFDSQPISWDDDLKGIQLSMNMERIERIGMSPYLMLHGFVLQRTDFVEIYKDEPADQRNDKVRSTMDWAKQNVINMSRAIGDHYLQTEYFKIRQNQSNSNPENDSKLYVGQKVLRYYNLCPGESQKLWQAWKGTFKVINKLDRHTYVVAKENDGRKKFICHRNRLRPIGRIQIKDEHYEGTSSKEPNFPTIPETTATDVQTEVKTNETLPNRRSDRNIGKIIDYCELGPE